MIIYASLKFKNRQKILMQALIFLLFPLNILAIKSFHKTFTIHYLYNTM